jgi:hypothetical protein
MCYERVSFQEQLQQLTQWFLHYNEIVYSRWELLGSETQTVIVGSLQGCLWREDLVKLNNSTSRMNADPELCSRLDLLYCNHT